MHLGALIAQLESENDAADALEALGDIVLFAAVSQAGLRHQESPGRYVARAVARFADGATDEDWIGLMSQIGGADDPAQVALACMLEWSLGREAADGQIAHRHGCACAGPHGTPGR